MRPFYRAQKHVSALNWQIVNICLTNIDLDVIRKNRQQ